MESRCDPTAKPIPKFFRTLFAAKLLPVES
jgi:hypothetical protein